MAEENYHLEIASDPKNLLTIEEFVNYFGIDLGLSEDKIQNLLLAVTEAVTNAIIHGNKSNPELVVKIDAFKKNDDLFVKVFDSGCGFDIHKIPDPTSPENLLKDSGRGIYLMKIYMDDVIYNKLPYGNETVLIMHLD